MAGACEYATKPSTPTATTATVEIELASNRTFRLEVVRVVKGSANGYDVHYYERETLYKTPKGTITSEPIADALQFYAWVPDLDLPNVDSTSPSPDAALQQALKWLADRCNNQNISW